MNLSVVHSPDQSLDVHVSGDENSRGIGHFARLREEFSTGEVRHALIRQDHGHLRTVKHFQRPISVGACHHLEILFEQIVNRVKNLWLIIYYQHLRLVHLLRHSSILKALFNEIGMVRTNSVPSSARLVNSISPP